MTSTNGVGTNAPPAIPGPIVHFWNGQPHLVHIAIIVGLAFVAHAIVKSIRHLSEWLITKSHEKRHPLSFVTQQPKFITLTRLVVSAVTFLIYALAILFVMTNRMIDG